MKLFKSIVAALSGAAVAPAAATAAPLAGQVTPRADVLTGAFAEGFIGQADKDRYPVRTVRVGELNLSSGRLHALDPLVFVGDSEPFALNVPPGRYPVDLAVADAGESGQRVALARVKFSDAPATGWRLAHTASQDPSTLSGDSIFAYPVDAGTGAFADGDALTALDAQARAEPQAYEQLTERWLDDGERAGEALGVPYLFTLTVADGGMVMFSSGWGDGQYASWVGYDAAGEPVAVVTDFAVIEAVDFPPAVAPR